MGISVEVFVKNFTNNVKAGEKTLADYLKKHITTEYIGIADKDLYCTHIVDSSTHTTQGERRIIKFNGVTRYIFFVMKLIELYTDIEIDKTGKKLISQYDALNKVGAIEALMAAIPESEYAEFSTILNIKLDDMRDNEYSVEAILYNLKESFSISEDVINSAINEVIEKNKETD